MDIYNGLSEISSFQDGCQSQTQENTNVYNLGDDIVTLSILWTLS